MIHRLISLLFITISCLQAAPRSSITQYGVTWYFGKTYETGRFVSGDWWVMPDTPGGTVIVDSVFPAPTQEVGSAINGSMVNPMPRPGEASQAFDERANQYDAALGTAYPVTLSADQSLASAACYVAADDGPSYMNIKYIAVLTCLAEAAESTDFRPPYVGTEKPVYSSAGLRRDLLPSLPAVDDTPDMAALAGARFSRPWIDFPHQWSANNIRGSYESNYGREKAVDAGAAALLLALDTADVGSKEPLLLGFVQTGIDLYHTLKSGGGWPPNGGHLMGRKLPILFAGLMLQNDSMLAVGRTYPACSGVFHEDDMAFIVSPEDTARELLCMVDGTATGATDTSIRIEGYPNVPKYVRLRGNVIRIIAGPGAGQERYITSDNCGWGTPPDTVHLTVEPAWETVPVPGQSEYGIPGYEARHLGKAEWNANACSNKATANPSYYQPYRSINTQSWPGEVLAARMFGLKEYWNQHAVFQLMDEFMEIDRKPGGFYEGAGSNNTGDIPPPSDGPSYSVSGAFIDNMWDAYRADYGCVLTGIDTVAHAAVYNCDSCMHWCPQGSSSAVAGPSAGNPAAVSVFPNPVRDMLYITGATDGFGVYDRTGVLRYRSITNAAYGSIRSWDRTDVAGVRVEPGVYFVRSGDYVRRVMITE